MVDVSKDCLLRLLLRQSMPTVCQYTVHAALCALYLVECYSCSTIIIKYKIHFIYIHVTSGGYNKQRRNAKVNSYLILRSLTEPVLSGH